MHAIKDFKKGLHHAADSISMIWVHKVLLLYLGIPAIITIFLVIAFYNVLLFGISSQHHYGLASDIASVTQQLISGPDWIRYIAKIITLFITLFITIIFNVALVWHAKKITEKKTTSFLTSMRASIDYYPILLIWTGISVLESLILQNRSSITTQGALSQSALGIAVSIIFLLCNVAWALLTFFVIQVIVFEEETNILRIITKSGTFAAKLFFSILGGECWFLLIALLTISPPALLAFIYPLWHITFGTIVIILVVKSILATAQALFKTILYRGATSKSVFSWFS